MPIYEYECTKCTKTIEVLQSFNDLPLKTCDSCHEESLRKVITGCSFRLKGANWPSKQIKEVNKYKKDMIEGQEE